MAYGGVDVRIEDVRSPDGSFDPATLVLALARAVMGLGAQDSFPGTPVHREKRPPLLPQGNPRVVERRPSQPLYRVRLAPDYSSLVRSPRETGVWSPPMSGGRSPMLQGSVGSIPHTRSAPSLHDWHAGIPHPGIPGSPALAMQPPPFPAPPAPPGPPMLQDVASQLRLARLPPLQPLPPPGACLIPANVPTRPSVSLGPPNATPFLPGARRHPLGYHAGAMPFGANVDHDDAVSIAHID